MFFRSFPITFRKRKFWIGSLEAMVNGVPVISTNSGGLPEVNIHGVSGYLANIGDVEAMGDFGIKILGDENTLKKFKENALEQAKTFDIDIVVPQYEALYEKALAEIKKA